MVWPRGGRVYDGNPEGLGRVVLDGGGTIFLDEGGHFAAWEQPEPFVAELRASFKSLR
jgi:hypothetical protein